MAVSLTQVAQRTPDIRFFAWNVAAIHQAWDSSPNALLAAAEKSTGLIVRDFSLKFADTSDATTSKQGADE